MCTAIITTSLSDRAGTDTIKLCPLQCAPPRWLAHCSHPKGCCCLCKHVREPHILPKYPWCITAPSHWISQGAACTGAAGVPRLALASGGSGACMAPCLPPPPGSCPAHLRALPLCSVKPWVAWPWVVGQLPQNGPEGHGPRLELWRPHFSG
jgi:hypothetical protein